MSYPVTQMAKTRVFRGRDVLFPAFGAALAEARGTREVGAVIQRIHKDSEFGDVLKGVDHARLQFYEAGTVQAPDPILLWALASIYGKNLMDWLRLLLWNRKHLGERDAPEGVRNIGEADMMRVSADDRVLIRKLRGLPSDAQERVIHQIDMEMLMLTSKGGARGAEGGTFRSSRGKR